jgi:hypothetical protein
MPITAVLQVALGTILAHEAAWRGLIFSPPSMHEQAN